MEPEASVHAPESAPKEASRWEDFVDVFLSPRELFRRRADDYWWVAMLVLSMGSLALFIAFSPVIRVIQETAMLNNPNVKPEQVEAVRNMGPLFLVLGGTWLVIMLWLITLVTGFLAWLTGKITSIDLPFRRALTTTAYVSLIGLVQQAASSLAMSLKLRAGAEVDLIRDSSFGVLRFLDSSSMNWAVLAALSRIDIFALWVFAWYVVAFMAAARAPRGAAMITATVPWLFGGLLYLLNVMGSR
jgi:Yip1-like protein